MRSVEWRRASSYVAVAFLAVLAVSALAQTSVTVSQSKASDDVVGIREAAERFLRVFDNLDWEPFRASWASEPTVFFPSATHRSELPVTERSKRAGGAFSRKRGHGVPGRP